MELRTIEDEKKKKKKNREGKAHDFLARRETKVAVALASCYESFLR